MILSILQAEGQHLTAAEVYRKAKTELPHLSPGTVYRNLSLLTTDGDILKLSIPGKPDHYERKREKHDHMVCRICGRIRDVLIPGLLDAINYQTGEKALAYELLIYYICPVCRDKAQIGDDTRLKRN